MTSIISETQIHDHLYRSRVLRKAIKVVKQDVAHTIAKLSEFYTHTSNQALPLYSDEANACEADVRERLFIKASHSKGLNEYSNLIILFCIK